MPTKQMTTKQAEARERLVDLLDRKTFAPVLRAREDRYSESQRKLLGCIKHKTESQRERPRPPKRRTKISTTTARRSQLGITRQHRPQHTTEALKHGLNDPLKVVFVRHTTESVTWSGVDCPAGGAEASTLPEALGVANRLYGGVGPIVPPGLGRELRARGV
jgi:hypothetical protein